MLKKAIIGTLFVALAAGFILGRDCVSYMRTMGNSVRDAVKPAMNLDFEIKRAHDMIDQLDPAIENAQEQVITQQTELTRMELKVAKREADLNKQEQLIMARRADLGSGDERFKYAGISYRRAELVRDLEVRFNAFRHGEKSLNHDKKMMLARRETLSANVKKLSAMSEQREELKVAVAELQARLEQLRAEEAIQKLSINDSELNQARDLIQKLSDEIDVKTAMQAAHGTVPGIIPETTDAATSDDIAAEIDNYFGNASDEVEETADEVLDPAA